MEKAVIIGKRIECIIGIVLLVPVFIGVIAFVLCLFDCDNEFCTLQNLSQEWSYSLAWFGNLSSSNITSAGAMSSAPIYLGLMAIAGVYMIKDSVKYWFMKTNKAQENK